ncbi:MAG TPA: hypothetical protein PLF32_03705 [Bacteroidales bacterium]|nr:hypothetical protein [Bacteroidales bacterium]HOR81739.1 hypothetical protein [Bacteroidales bacterium]HPJ91194.1 hypothetical protein [Bacteroidales bacterium]
MKSKIILLFLIMFAAIIYIVCDYYLYYYGKNTLNIYKKIITIVTPERRDRSSCYRNEGFALLKNGRTYIAKGNVYRGYPKIKVDSIVSYGFNDSVIVGLFISKDKESYFVIMDNSSYNVKLLSYKEYSINEIIKLYNLKKWIYNVNNPPLLLSFIRRLSFLVIYISLILFLIKVMRNRNVSK